MFLVRAVAAGRKAERAGFLRGSGGAASIEYGLIAALIAIALVTGGTQLSNSLANVFLEISMAMSPGPPMLQDPGH